MKKHVLLGLTFLVNIAGFSQREVLLQNEIGNFFSYMQKSDTASLGKLLDEHCELISVFRRKDSVQMRHESRSEFLTMIATPLPDPWEEKILNYQFIHDELMSTVITEYEFVYDGKFSHSGINQFTFTYNEKNAVQPLRILSIIDTRYFLGQGDIKNAEHKKNEESVIQTLLNNWHMSAAKANESEFFGVMSDSCIYKGTDETERWTKSEFLKFAHPYFEKGKAWDFKPLERHIYFDDNLQTAWFDEKLDTWMGVCKGSGVLQRENGEWKLMLYDLSVTIANDKIKSFIKLVNDK